MRKPFTPSVLPALLFLFGLFISLAAPSKAQFITPNDVYGTNTANIQVTATEIIAYASGSAWHVTPLSPSDTRLAAYLDINTVHNWANTGGTPKNPGLPISETAEAPTVWTYEIHIPRSNFGSGTHTVHWYGFAHGSPTVTSSAIDWDLTTTFTNP